MTQPKERDQGDVESQHEQNARASADVTDPISLQEVASSYRKKLPQWLFSKQYYSDFVSAAMKEDSTNFRALQMTDFEGFGVGYMSKPMRSSPLINEARYSRLRSGRFHVIAAENVMVDDTFVLGAVLDIDPCFIVQHIQIHYQQDGPQACHHRDVEDPFSSKKWFHLNATDLDACLRFCSPPSIGLMRPLISIYQRCESSYFVLISTEEPHSSSRPPNVDVPLVTKGPYLPGDGVRGSHFGLLRFIVQIFEETSDRQVIDRLLEALTKDWSHSSSATDPIPQKYCDWLNMRACQCVIQQMNLECDWFAGEALDEPNLDTFKRLVWSRKLLKKLESYVRYLRCISADLLVVGAMRETTDAAGETQDHGDGAPTPDLAQPNTALDAGSQEYGRSFDDMEDDLKALTVALKESYEPLIGAITVLDSAANREQAQQAKLLTLLAAIYLPATLATGIFGMNIAEVSGDMSAPKWWAVVATFAALFTLSLVFILFVFRSGIKKKMVAMRESNRRIWLRLDYRMEGLWQWMKKFKRSNRIRR